MLGFALNGFNSPDFLRPPVIHFDIIQIIALGSLAVYLLEFYFKPHAWVYLLLGLASFLIKLGLDVVLPAKDHPLLAGVLLTYSGTFPLFPWLFLFFLGVFTYRLGILPNLLWLAASIVLFPALAMLGVDLDERSKYDMSTGYFLLCCLLLFGLFFLFRYLRFLHWESVLNPVLFFGRNSLLFLFVHFAALGVLSSRLQLDENVRAFRLYPFLFWLLILCVAWAVMAALGFAARLHELGILFDRLWIWILLAALVLAIPALVPHNGLVRWTEAVLGTIFGLYYHRLGRALKQRQASSAA